MVAVGVGILVLPRVLGGEMARRRLEGILADALGRPVTIGDVDVASDAPRVELLDVVVGEIDPFVDLGQGGPLAATSTVRFDIGIDKLLDRRLVGSVTANAVELHVVRKDGALNVRGIGRRPPSTREPLDLELTVEVEDARIVIEDLDRGETLVLTDVDVRALLSNRADARDAALHVTIAELDLHGVLLHDVRLHGNVAPDRWVVHRLTAKLGERGTVEGAGELALGAEGGPAFSVQAAASDVALDGPLADAVARLFPAIAAAREPGVGGQLDATVDLRGAGLTWDTIAPTLTGTGQVVLRDVHVPADTLLVRVAAIAGRPSQPWVLDHGSAGFSIADRWVTLGAVTTGGEAIDPHFSGRVSLAGDLDLAVDAMPLLRIFDEKVYADVARYTTSLPVRIEGTIADPKLRAPAPRDVAKGVMGGLLRRALTDPPAEATAP